MLDSRDYREMVEQNISEELGRLFNLGYITITNNDDFEGPIENVYEQYPNLLEGDYE